MSPVHSFLLLLQDPLTTAALVLTLILLSWIFLKLRRACKRPSSFSLHTKDPLKAHVWEKTRYLDKPTYCNMCEELCLAGSQCQCCGACVCTLSICLKTAKSKLNCKPLSLTQSSHTPHFFVRGNLPLSSSCEKCQTSCGSLPELLDYKCTWCDQTFHEGCLGEKEKDSHCNFGPHRGSIVAPHCVELDRKGWRGRKR